MESSVWKEMSVSNIFYFWNGSKLCIGGLEKADVYTHEESNTYSFSYDRELSNGGSRNVAIAIDTAVIVTI